MKKKTKIAFFGSRPLSLRCLEILRSHPEAEIVGVVAPPDPKKKWWTGSLREFAQETSLPLSEESDILKKEIDLAFSVLYPRIVRPPLLTHPKAGFINLHTGPLPKFRGRNGPAHAILNARKDNSWEYGATLHYMEEAVDRGPILKVKTFKFTEEDTCEDVYHRTEEASFELFASELSNILSGKINPQPQGEGTYYYAKDSLGKKEVDLKWDPETLWDFVRAMYFPPFEKAYIKVGERKIYLSPK